MKNQLQQGDVLLEKIKSIPTQAKKKKPEKRGYILAEGEHTGHFHAITAEEGIEFYEYEGTLFLRTDHEVELTHQEHNTVMVEPGTYKIGRVREMDYTQMMVREVAD